MSEAALAPEKAPHEERSWKELWLITMGHGLTHWYPSTFYLLLPIIGKELGLTYSQIGLVMTCQFIAGAIANLPVGMSVDTVGRKGVLMALSLFWVGFPYLLMGFAHGYLMLLACVALVGFGNSLWHPTAIPTLARRYPERKGLVLSLHGMGGNVGDALAPLAVGSLPAVLSWREIVILNVMPGLVMSLLILVFLGTLRVGSKAKPGAAEGQVQSLGDYFRGVPALFRTRSLVLLIERRVPVDDAEHAHIPAGLPLTRCISPGRVVLPCSPCRPRDSPHLPWQVTFRRTGRRSIMMTSMIMTGVVLAFMTFCRHCRRSSSWSRCWDSVLRHPSVLQACSSHAEEHGWHEHRHPVRRAVAGFLRSRRS